MLTVRRAQPEVACLGTAGEADRSGVTLVNFDPGYGAARGERALPDGGEQAVRLAAAQPVGALPAHARFAGGGGDASGAGEGVEEGELAGDGPPVPSTSLRTGPADGLRSCG